MRGGAPRGGVQPLRAVVRSGPSPELVLRRLRTLPGPLTVTRLLRGARVCARGVGGQARPVLLDASASGLTGGASGVEVVGTPPGEVLRPGQVEDRLPRWSDPRHAHLRGAVGYSVPITGSAASDTGAADCAHGTDAPEIATAANPNSPWARASASPNSGRDRSPSPGSGLPPRDRPPDARSHQAGQRPTPAGVPRSWPMRSRRTVPRPAAGLRQSATNTPRPAANRQCEAGGRQQAGVGRPFGATQTGWCPVSSGQVWAGHVVVAPWLARPVLEP